MHILFISERSDKGGAAISMQQMVTGLLRIDPSIKISVILSHKNSLVDKYRSMGCSVYTTLYYNALQPRTDLLRLVKRATMYGVGRIYGIRDLERKFNVSEVDIIHCNGTRTDIGAILAMKYKKPLIWHIREFGDLDFGVFSLRRGYIALMNKAATEMIAISDAVREHWIGKGIRPEKIVRIYNGVDDSIPQKTHYRKDSSVPLRLVMAGSISETKGQGQLLEAIGKLPPKIQRKIRLDIIGGTNNKYAKRLQKIINEEGVFCSTRMLGYRQDVCDLLHEYDCGIMCSRSEGFGRVTAEYMMAGLPVIASDTGTNPELIREGVTGLFYRWGDTTDLAKKIEILADDASLCEKMGRQAAEFARSNFTARINAERVYAEYLRILSPGRLPGGGYRPEIIVVAVCAFAYTRADGLCAAFSFGGVAHG